MSEEKKEQTSAKASQGKPEEKKPKEAEKPKNEQVEPTKEKPKEVPQKPQKPAECVSCGKNIKNQWYYRNGKYYCTKSCWKKSKKSGEKAKEKTA